MHTYICIFIFILSIYMLYMLDLYTYKHHLYTPLHSISKMYIYFHISPLTSPKKTPITLPFPPPKKTRSLIAEGWLSANHFVDQNAWGAGFLLKFYTPWVIRVRWLEDGSRQQKSGRFLLYTRCVYICIIYIPRAPMSIYS